MPASRYSIEAFEAGRIETDAFDHESHVYVAWLYVREYPLPEAIAKYTGALRRLTESLGVPEKYHATVTWFYLLQIAERRAAAPELDWAGFRDVNRDLFRRSPGLLARYYSADLLGSPRARSGFVFPDRAAAAV